MRRFDFGAWGADRDTPDRICIAGRDYALVLKRHPRARTIRLRTDPAREAVVITMPQRARSRDAIAFAQSQAGWIADSFARAGPALPIVPGATLPWRGDPHRIAWDQAASRRPAVVPGLIRLGGPVEQLEARLLRWMRREARAAFIADAADYAARADEPPVRIALSNAARRWGSCSADRTVRLNWRLILAPDWVRRSVVAHEIAHLRHMNHSPAFYAWLDRLYEGDRRAADAWLKRHGRGLYRVGAAV